MLDVSKEDILEGSIPKVLVTLTLPMIATQLILIVQQFVDIFWLGRLDEAAVAAVGLVTPLMGFLFFGTSIGAIGGQIVVSQRIGGGDEVGARRTAFNAVLVSAAITLVFAVVVNVFATSIVGLFTADPTVHTDAVTYITVVAFGIVLASVSDTLEGAFVAWGDSRMPLLATVLAIATNVVLDPIFIFGWGPIRPMGVRGAALATLLGMGIAAVFNFGVAASGRRAFSLTWNSLRFNPEMSREIVTIGVPRGSQQLVRHVTQLLLVVMASISAGPAGLAAYMIGFRVLGLTKAVSYSISNAATSVIGQNVGADSSDRANRTTWVAVGMAVAAGLLLAVIQVAAPGAIVHFLSPKLHGRAYRLTVDALVVLAFGYWASAAIIAVEAGFNGAGQTRITMLSSIAQNWGLLVPMAALGVFGLENGFESIFWATTLSSGLVAIGLCAYYYYSASGGMLQRASAHAAQRAEATD